jgi:hypothetical protein
LLAQTASPGTETRGVFLEALAGGVEAQGIVGTLVFIAVVFSYFLKWE